MAIFDYKNSKIRVGTSFSSFFRTRSVSRIFVPSRKPTRKFGKKFGMQGLTKILHDPSYFLEKSPRSEMEVFQKEVISCRPSFIPRHLKQKCNLLINCLFVHTILVFDSYIFQNISPISMQSVIQSIRPIGWETLIWWKFIQPFSSFGTFETLLSVWQSQDTQISANLRILTEPCKELGEPRLKKHWSSI